MIGVCAWLSIVAVGAWLVMARAPVRLPANAALPMTRPIIGGAGMDGLAWLGRLLPRSEQAGRSLETTLRLVGSRLSVRSFGGLQVVSACWMVVLAGVLIVEWKGITPWVIPAAGGAGFVLPWMWLRAKSQRRHQAIVRLMPEVVDLLTLCLGAGLDFLSALKRITAIAAFQKEPFIEELSSTLQEIRVGKRRADALRAMAKRVDVPELTSFVRTLVQADRMGTPITEALTTHAEDVRFQRFMRAERAALKAPIKILIPLIFFILPCVGMIVGAPIFLQFTKQNPFAK